MIVFFVGLFFVFFFAEERNNGQLMAEQIEATRPGAPEGGLWHERKDPKPS